MNRTCTLEITGFETSKIIEHGKDRRTYSIGFKCREYCIFPSTDSRPICSDIILLEDVQSIEINYTCPGGECDDLQYRIYIARL